MTSRALVGIERRAALGLLGRVDPIVDGLALRIDADTMKEMTITLASVLCI
jgi:hypothetical protein